MSLNTGSVVPMSVPPVPSLANKLEEIASNINMCHEILDGAYNLPTPVEGQKSSISPGVNVLISDLCESTKMLRDRINNLRAEIGQF